MAISWQPTIGQTVTVVNSGTPVAVTTPPFENTNTIVVYNSHATQDLFLSWQAAGGPAITAANGVTIPAATSLTLAIGTLEERPGVTTDLLTFDSDGNGTAGYVTYVQSAFS